MPTKYSRGCMNDGDLSVKTHVWRRGFTLAGLNNLEPQVQVRNTSILFSPQVSLRIEFAIVDVRKYWPFSYQTIMCYSYAEEIKPRQQNVVALNSLFY